MRSLRGFPLHVPWSVVWIPNRIPILPTLMRGNGKLRCKIEKLENLEQLRVLCAGHAIVVGVTHQASIGIDTPEDYAAFVARRLAG